MKKLLIISVLIIGLSALFLNLSAQEEDKASESAASETLEVTIDEVEGTVEVKKADGKEWITAEKGMKVKEGTKISTGFKSKATLLFADNSTVVVKSLTQMTINNFIKEGNKVKTKLKLRIGTLRVKVKEKQPVKTDMKISTPNATASVRGTKIKEIDSSPLFGDTYAVETGRVVIEDKVGAKKSLKKGETTDEKLTDPIDHALLKQVVNVTPIGTTQEETNDALTSVAVPTVPDVLIGDTTSETSDPTVARIIAQEEPCPPPDYGNGEPEEEIITYPAWYIGETCPVCYVHPCECSPCGCGSGSPDWYCCGV